MNSKRTDQRELYDNFIPGRLSTYRGWGGEVARSSTASPNGINCVIAVVVIIVDSVVESYDGVWVDASIHNQRIIHDVEVGDRSAPSVGCWLLQVFRSDAIVVMQHHRHVLLTQRATVMLGKPH